MRYPTGLAALTLLMAGCTAPLLGPGASSPAPGPASTSPVSAPSSTRSPDPTPTPPASLTPRVNPAQENVGIMPRGFKLEKWYSNEADFAAIRICRRVPYPALAEREASRFNAGSSESGESGGAEAGIVMTSEDAAARLFLQIQAAAQDCIENPPEEGESVVRTIETDSDIEGDDVLALLSERLDAGGASSDFSYGTAQVIVRQGRSLAARAYWIYFATPISGEDGSGLTETMNARLAALLKPLPR